MRLGLLELCVSTVSYVVLVNGQPGSIIKPSRGIYQGNLISPYLYLIYAERLSLLLNEAEKSSLIKRVNVARGSPMVNYLFFTDDSIVFYRANITEWQEYNNYWIYMKPILVKGSTN